MWHVISFWVFWWRQVANLINEIKWVAMAANFSMNVWSASLAVELCCFRATRATRTLEGCLPRKVTLLLWHMLWNRPANFIPIIEKLWLWEWKQSVHFRSARLQLRLSEWKRVEASGGEWKRVEASGSEWKRVEGSFCSPVYPQSCCIPAVLQCACVEPLQNPL